MQWILILIGVALGGYLDELPTGAALGALAGFSLGQAIRLARLRNQLAEQCRHFEAVQRHLALLESVPRVTYTSTTPLMLEAPPASTREWPIAEELKGSAAPYLIIATRTQISTVIDRTLTRTWAWLPDGKSVLRISVMLTLLLLGLTFELHDATGELIVPEARYAIVAACASGLLARGWWLRRRDRNYALMMQGTALAILYLTVSAAVRLPPLFDPGVAFGLLALVTLFSVILAIKQNAQRLAATSILGGFATPLLASTGADNHVALFSYLALLNVGIFAIARFKAWRLLNLIGFMGLFGCGLAWGLGNLYSEKNWLADGDFCTPLVIALAAMVSAWLYQPQTSNLTTLRLGMALPIWAGGWWVVTLVGGVLRFAAVEVQLASLLLLLAASGTLGMVVALRLRWAELAVLCTLLAPTCCIVLLLTAMNTDYHPAAHWGWLAWGAVFVVHLLSLHRLENLLSARVISVAHVVGCWLIIGVLALELRFGSIQLSVHYDAWRWLGWAFLPSVYLLAMAVPREWPWPIAIYPREYRVWAAAPLALLMLIWFWLANIISDGSAEPLPYYPLLNPLDLGLLFALAGVFIWSRNRLPQLDISHEHAQRAAQLIAGVSLFALITAMVMRSAHHWSGVPYQLDDLLNSMRVQAGLSITWALMALALMIGGHLRGRRDIWIVGAALMGVVIAKLFFIELSNQGELAHIVSFIGVGVMLLVVGYFSPLPPKPSLSKPLSAGPAASDSPSPSP